MSEKQLTLDKRYIRMAGIWAENSYCTRRKVGALIVKDKMIISDGYNGTPAGFENICEDDNGVTKPYVLHAEANGLTISTASTGPIDARAIRPNPSSWLFLPDLTAQMPSPNAIINGTDTAPVVTPTLSNARGKKLIGANIPRINANA